MRLSPIESQRRLVGAEAPGTRRGRLLILPLTDGHRVVLGVVRVVVVTGDLFPSVLDARDTIQENAELESALIVAI